MYTFNPQLTVQPPDAPPVVRGRPAVKGKFLYIGDEKLYVRGVTYGPFRPDQAGSEYHTLEQVEKDFAQMRAHHINAVRTYTVPPRWLLDAAGRHGLYVMVGLPWEQHITFLDDRGRAEAIVQRVREAVRSSAQHPAILCYTIGNEIPAPIVRWHGPQPVADFLKRLYRAVKVEDPEALVTYVNFPTTEYLQLPFVDLYCFNVYLEAQETLEAYLARLQNLACDRPLIMAEIGLDSRRNGREAQARTLDWQVRTAFGAGCAGAFVFSWTDEWHRGGFDIEDWDFGLTERDRTPKPALEAVRDAFADVPFPHHWEGPAFSVVMCSHNGAATIRESLEALQRVRYPSFEVIVVDDGSTDATAAIALEYDVRLIRTENRGLSAARNTGLEAATGEFIAYLDDDAYPDLDWLTYLAATFMRTGYAAVGGPNIAPPGDGLVADAVDKSPGNPAHVLLTDQVAEHIPGCNMAVRKQALQAIGGFDSRFRIAGDDVDACWRLQEAGGTLGFSPAAVVWHHRRSTVRTYWRQQKNYGKAEALLEEKWPEKYNHLGHMRWQGRVYNDGLRDVSIFQRWRIYYGVWGSQLFQSIYAPAPSVIRLIPLMPEWYLIIAALALITATGLFWPPLLVGLVPLALAVGALLFRAAAEATQAVAKKRPRARSHRYKLWLLTVWLHLTQPLARLVGRIRYGLAPWRRRGSTDFKFLYPRTVQLWNEQWRSSKSWLRSVEAALRRRQVHVVRGGAWDRWDLEMRAGAFGAVRLLMTLEEHGGGKQQVRFKMWPRASRIVWTLLGLLCLPFAGAVVDWAWTASIVLGGLMLLLLGRTLLEWSATSWLILQAIEDLEPDTE